MLQFSYYLFQMHLMRKRSPKNQIHIQTEIQYWETIITGIINNKQKTNIYLYLLLQHMRKIAICLLFLSVAIAIKVNKYIPLRMLAYNPQTIFLSKFDFGNNDGQITVRFSKFGSKNFQIPTLKFGILSDEKFDAHRKAQTCEQKQTYYRESHQVKFFSPKQGVQILKINSSPQKRTWFIFLYVCDYVQFDETLEDAGMSLDLLTFDVGAHFGQNKALLWPYTVLFIFWCLSLYKMGNSIKQTLMNFRNIAANLLSLGYLLLGLSIFYRFMSIWSTVMTGEGIQLFNALYIGFKATIEVIMVTVLAAISWGWLLNNNNYRFHYLGIILLVTILNFITLIIANQNSQQGSTQHLYQGFFGKMVLFIRILISLIFLSGCLYISLQSSQKRKGFINNFAEFGSLYMFSGLLSLILAEIFTPTYLHAEIITFLQELIRLVANICMCWIFLMPNTNNKQLQKRQSKGFNYFGQTYDGDQQYSLSSGNRYEGRSYQDF